MASPTAAPFELDVFLSEADWAQHLEQVTLRGLRDDPPWTPPVWFYDGVGSDLFDRITRLPEYYPTRAERAILRAHAGDIARLARANNLVELGAGSADKTRLLLRALIDVGTLQRFIPVDCSEPALQIAADQVAAEFPDLAVHAIVADFNAHLPRVPCEPLRMLAFLGSTIGNFTALERARFLSAVARRLGPGDTFLLGTDLAKDPRRLIAAYDDAAGVTADFNLNSLAVMNRQLGADFDPSAFAHRSVWNGAESRIEMWLVAQEAQRVTFSRLGGHVLQLSPGEYLRTEISVKFTPAQVRREFAAAGLAPIAQWFDPAVDFMLTLAGLADDLR
jgi:L-histidine Nalpha-methyltransferase